MITATEQDWEAAQNQAQVYQPVGPTNAELGQTGQSAENENKDLSEYEKYLLKSPTSFAAYSTFRDFLAFIPFAKYALPSERERFMRLTESEQREALLWQAAGAGLDAAFMKVPSLIRGSIALGAKTFRKAPKVFSPADAYAELNRIAPALKAKSFVFSEQAMNKFTKMGMYPEEAEAVTRALQLTGEAYREEAPNILGQAVISISQAKKKLSPAFQKLTRWDPARENVRLLSLGTRLDYGEAALFSEHQISQFSRGLRNLVETKHFKVTPRFLNEAFDNQVARLYPDLVGKLELGKIGSEEFSNILLDLLRVSPVAKRLTQVGMGRKIPLLFQPARVAFGSGEAALGTYSGVYLPLIKHFEQAQKAHYLNILDWNLMLEQAGLGKVKVTATKFRLTKPKFTSEHQQEAFEFLTKTDNLSEAIRRASKEEVPELTQALTKLESSLDPRSPTFRLVHTWRAFSDKLYGDFTKAQIQRTFRKANLTPLGQDAFQGRVFPEIEKMIDETFSPKSALSATDKIEVVSKAQKMLNNWVDTPGFSDLLSGTTSFKGVKLTKQRLKNRVAIAEELKKQLTQRKDGGSLIGYNTNYTARIAQDAERQANRWTVDLLGKDPRAAFIKQRLVEQHNPVVDFGSMIESRSFAQAKELFLYDGLDDIVGFARSLPSGWAEYSEHFISRALNRPSVADYKTAVVLEKYFGGVERLFGRSGDWSSRRVMQLGQAINNFTYMGALGFKPFSAIRNLFQPLILVPADLGGIKDFVTLARGLKGTFDPKIRQTLREIGIIKEYAPEISYRPQALPFGTKTLGFSRQGMDQIRDYSMFMFRASDQFNRYVTGSSSLIKWQDALTKLGGEEVLHSTNLAIRAGAVSRFSNLVKLSGRQPWEANEIRELLLRGQFDQARSAYVRSVVADTQYLYGTLEAPIALGRSSLGKTGWVFQSWWMNYANAIEKWMVTGSSGIDKTNRIFTAMSSAALSYTIMESMWGPTKAAKAVGLGPFPKAFNEFAIPPAWTPIYHLLSTISSVPDIELSGKHLKRLAQSLPVFVPGGLQAMAMIRGTRKEGFPGFLKSIIQYKGSED